jgi:hypothetical protein
MRTGGFYTPLASHTPNPPSSRRLSPPHAAGHSGQGHRFPDVRVVERCWPVCVDVHRVVDHHRHSRRHGVTAVRVTQALVTLALLVCMRTLTVVTRPVLFGLPASLCCAALRGAQGQKWRDCGCPPGSSPGCCAVRPPPGSTFECTEILCSSAAQQRWRALAVRAAQRSGGSHSAPAPTAYRYSGFVRFVRFPDMPGKER